MTWREAKTIVEKEYNQFNNMQALVRLQSTKPLPAYPDAASLKKDLIAKEHALREPLDLACKRFAQVRTWPKLNEDELLLLGQRLGATVNFLHLLETTHEDDQIVPDSKTPDWRVLEFLLVDYWRRIGYAEYLLQITSLPEGGGQSPSDDSPGGQLPPSRPGPGHGPSRG